MRGYGLLSKSRPRSLPKSDRLIHETRPWTHGYEYNIMICSAEIIRGIVIDFFAKKLA